jgi:hypothetical protein
MPVAAAFAVGGIATAVGGYVSSKGNQHAAQTGSDAAVKAAQIQADAATKAAALATDANRDAANAQLKAAEDALSFQKAVYAQKQAQVAPYLGIGQGALSSLSQGLGVRSVPQPPPAMPPSAPTATGIPTYTIDQPSGATPAANGSTLSALSSPLGLSPTAAPPQTATGTGRAAQVGEQRMINGAPATWDGRGWKATPQAATATGAA